MALFEWLAKDGLIKGRFARTVGSNRPESVRNDVVRPRSGLMRALVAPQRAHLSPGSIQ